MPMIKQKGYLNNIYSKHERPKTEYPIKLAKRLMDVHSIMPGTKVLDLGAGRAEVSRGFVDNGLSVVALDRDESFRDELIEAGIDFVLADVFDNKLPFEDASFDLIYSKSFLEHLPNPETILQECIRILKPGGRILNLVPDWEANFKIYFDDHTHKTPFTTTTMRDLYRICGFEPGIIRTFRQLPVTWRYPGLNILLNLIAPFIPVRTKNKFLRWSRELMIEGVGYKR